MNDKSFEFLKILMELYDKEFPVKDLLMNVCNSISKELGFINNDHKTDQDFRTYVDAINEIADSHTLPKYLVTNEIIYNAYKSHRLDGEIVELYFNRRSGLTTSLLALAKAFDDVIVVTSHTVARNAKNQYELKNVLTTIERDCNVRDKIILVDATKHYKHFDYVLPFAKKVIQTYEIEKGF